MIARDYADGDWQGWDLKAVRLWSTSSLLRSKPRVERKAERVFLGLET